jgi:hypothetical protein
METIADIEKIRGLLSTQFENDLFDSSIRNLEELDNKLRFNNFAYAIRELSRHILNTLSPEKNIKDCCWYVEENDTRKPTRAHKIKYAIQGGINDEILEQWGFNLEEFKETSKTILEAIDDLNKYTHINPEVFNLEVEHVKMQSQKVINAFLNFINTISSYRNVLKDFLDGNIEEQMMETTVYNFFENIDSLATHHSIDECYVSDYEVSDINDKYIIVYVSGSISATLEYGSRAERLADDGLDVNVSFPFTTSIQYEISVDFPVCNFEIAEYDADTSSWYE